MNCCYYDFIYRNIKRFKAMCFEPLFFWKVSRLNVKGTEFLSGEMEYTMRKNNLLENVLIEIEKGICEGCINANILARKFTLSEGHLRRLFRFEYKKTLTRYIRSRKLTASLNDLLKTDSNVIDIAQKYGFDYEQSYIRAFKREFGKTPGFLRKLREYHFPAL